MIASAGNMMPFGSTNSWNACSPHSRGDTLSRLLEWVLQAIVDTVERHPDTAH
jgi:hypothetical protein